METPLPAVDDPRKTDAMVSATPSGDPRKTVAMNPATPSGDPRKTVAMFDSPPGCQPESPVLSAATPSEAVPPLLVELNTLDALDDDTVTFILAHLAQNPQPQALARIGQCSKRMRRLAGTDSLWLSLCRSAFPYASLPADSAALQSCYAARVALPLRLAHELDLAIGGLQRLIAQQKAVGAPSEADDAEARQMEPPMYNLSGLDRELLHLPAGEGDAPPSVRLLPTTHPTLESLIMYRIFRAGLGLTTLGMPTSSRRTPVDDHAVAAAETEADLTDANPQLALLMEEAHGLLRESVAGSRRGAGSGGWVLEWCAAAQKRLECFDPWAQGTINWPDTPWRRSAIGFMLQFFSPAFAQEEGTVAILKRQVESLDLSLANVAEEGEDLSLPRSWVPRGLPRAGVEAEAHRWWFQTADEAVLAAGFLWGNRC